MALADQFSGQIPPDIMARLNDSVMSNNGPNYVQAPDGTIYYASTTQNSSTGQNTGINGYYSLSPEQAGRNTPGGLSPLYDTSGKLAGARPYTPDSGNITAGDWARGALFVGAAALGGEALGGALSGAGAGAIGTGGVSSAGIASGEGAALGGTGTGIAGVGGGGLAGTIGSGSAAMDAAAASDAGGGSLGGSIGASNTAPGLATTTGSGLNPAFDTLGNPADAGISGSPFTPATTQAPLPMTASDAAAASSNSGAALAGPTAGFTPSAAGAGLSALGGGGGTPTFGQAVSGLGSLGQVAGAIQGDNAQKQASNNMLDWLRSQQAKIDGLYQPGSPEYNLLSQQMAAKDAAAGRNSQYGTRAVDMAAKIAQTKAQYTAQLTNGIAGNMSSAFNQNASSNAGLNATIGNLTKTDANGNSQLSNGLSGLSGLSQYF